MDKYKHVRRQTWHTLKQESGQDWAVLQQCCTGPQRVQKGQYGNNGQEGSTEPLYRLLRVPGKAFQPVGGVTTNLHMKK